VYFIIARFHNRPGDPHHNTFYAAGVVPTICEFAVQHYAGLGDATPCGMYELKILTDIGDVLLHPRLDGTHPNGVPINLTLRVVERGYIHLETIYSK
jgi:hypothetical protein